MIFKLELRRRAFNQMQKSFQFYEFRSHGLGDRFLDTIYNYLQKIQNNPFLFSSINDSIREAYIK